MFFFGGGGAMNKIGLKEKKNKINKLKFKGKGKKEG